MNNQINIFYTYVSSDFDLQKYRALHAVLPTVLGQKVDRYKRYIDQVLGVVGKHLLLHCLQQLQLPLQLETYAYDSNNRPFLQSLPKLDFNISHSGNIVLCAASLEMRLGIDIEQMNPVQLSNFKHQFSKREWDSLQNTKDWQDLFFQYWVKKEALTKTDGSGLSIDFSTVEVLHNPTYFNKAFWLLTPFSIHPAYRSCIATNATPSIQLEEVKF